MLDLFFTKANYDGKCESQLLKCYFGKGHFTFVDVGANYPETSVSLIFEKLGWNGFVVYYCSTVRMKADVLYKGRFLIVNFQFILPGTGR